MDVRGLYFKADLVGKAKQKWQYWHSCIGETLFL